MHQQPSARLWAAEEVGGHRLADRRLYQMFSLSTCYKWSHLMKRLHELWPQVFCYQVYLWTIHDLT